MYYETGTSARPIHYRKMVSSKSELIRDINKYVEYANVYHTIYGFRKKEKKYSLSGEFTRYGPDYTTAVVDKIVLDIDAFQKVERRSTGQSFQYYTDKALFDMRKLEEWASKRNLLREYRFSGGGFYYIFAAKGSPLKLRDFILNLQNKLDIRVDPSVIGDASRMMRVTNSFNFKKYRNRYCIPLRKKELNLTFYEIRERAKYPRYNKRFIYGEEVENFSHCKIDKDKIQRKKFRVSLRHIDTNGDADKILKKYGWEIRDFCEGIKRVIGEDHIGNALRVELIKYLKTIVKLTYKDCVKVMVYLLGGEGLHSASEGQAKYVYSKDYVFTPTKLKGLGYCPLDCNKCNEYKKIFYQRLC